MSSTTVLKRVTPRDEQVLLYIHRFRFIQPNHLQDLVFYDRANMQVVRRRLRMLVHWELVSYIEPRVLGGKAFRIYYLTREGSNYIYDKGLITNNFAHSKSNTKSYRFLSHAVDCSQFGVHVTVAARNHEIVELDAYYTEFAVKQEANKLKGNNRYLYYQEFDNPFSKRPYVFYPDATFILKGRGELSRYKYIYYVEIDRGTEGLNVVQNKATAYQIFYNRNQEYFKQYGGVMRVLLQTVNQKRVEKIRKVIAEMNGGEYFWLTSIDQVNAKAILTKPIWTDFEGNQKSIIKG